MTRVNVYEAKTQLSRLVDRAAAGEEIIIAKNGKPKARLMPLKRLARRRRPAGALGVTFIAPDFDAVDDTIGELFESES
jgi:prevent-host-death family protein